MLKLYAICKDMDGLDRVRFNGLDIFMLRTPYAKKASADCRLSLAGEYRKCRILSAERVKSCRTKDAAYIKADETPVAPNLTRLLFQTKITFINIDITDRIVYN